MNGTMEPRRLSALGPNPLQANPLHSWSDEELLLSYRTDRDGGAFEELVHRYERELFAYLRHYLGNAEMAEDVFQQTFLQLHLKCEQFEPGRKVRPWLYTIATNQAIDYRRRNRRHRLSSLSPTACPNVVEEAHGLAELLGSPEMSPADNAESAEQCLALRQAVDGLAEKSREVVALVYFQGLKYCEAAEVLSIPVGTVKSRMHAALLTLTDALFPAKLAHSSRS
jgi:RNA polymerase sigma-70 factor (ECF subfamily)